MYEIRVEGLVPTSDLLRELGDVELVQHEFRTVLSGDFTDQAALYAFLQTLRSLGLEVVEVRLVPGPVAPDDATEGESDSGPVGGAGAG
jgi:hypothetical protein